MKYFIILIIDQFYCESPCTQIITCIDFFVAVLNILITSKAFVSYNNCTRAYNATFIYVNASLIYSVALHGPEI